MEAKPGREACVQRLLQGILGAIEDEPRALPWYQGCSTLLDGLY